jgi:hypothetical protein
MRFARSTPFCLSLLLYTAPCIAQTVDSTEEAFALAQGGTVPPYVVPVLRLVSKTHVEPTTGIVLSESGLVMVPAGRGGTDIVSNGRTARIEKNFPMDGLQVISVYGLRRPGAPFADSELEDGDSVRLTAFPPAEQIAEGAQPLDIRTTVTVFGESRKPAVSGETPLPNVTGPLLDECGNVAAISIANDIQTMETSPGTRYQWRETLLDVISLLGVRPAPSACIETSSLPEPEEQPAPLPEPEAKPEPVVEEALPEPEPEVPSDDEVMEPEQLEELEIAILPPIETADEPPQESGTTEEPESSGGWAWLLVAALLIAAGAGLHRWRTTLLRRNNAGISESPATPPPAPEDDDPEWQEPVMDSQLVLSGERADGSIIRASCEVSSQAVNVTIGRGQADLRIDSPAVSRQHAALNGTADALTITDLGSNNGTSINGVPCLEGEIMYLEPGDTVLLGDTRFTLELKPADEDETG